MSFGWKFDRLTEKRTPFQTDTNHLFLHFCNSEPLLWGTEGERTPYSCRSRRVSNNVDALEFEKKAHDSSVPEQFQPRFEM